MRSKLKYRVIIYTDAELYDRFYALKKEVRRQRRWRSMSNGAFLRIMLDTLEEKLMEEKMKKELRAY
jgi:hypothetical protein